MRRRSVYAFTCKQYRETMIKRDIGPDRFDHVSLTPDYIDESSLIQLVKSPKAGAVSSFIGTTRDTFEGKVVTYLEYEAYPDMALQCMLDICDAIREKWDVLNIVFQHKLGPCPIMATSIVIVISSAHRNESLEAVNFAINELKRVVPIWKKEFYDEGESIWKENKESINFSS